MRARTVWLVGILGSCLAQAACTSAATKQSVRLYEGGDYQAAAVAADRGIADDRGDDGAWQMRLRAALAMGDAAGVASHYAEYQKARGGDDLDLALELAQVTIGQALASPSVALRLSAIAAVEASELHDLADAVAQRMTDGDDRVVAAAAAAVLRGYADAATALDDMMRSEDPEARRLAVDGLGRKMAKYAQAELAAAAGDPEPSVRRTALGHLADLRDADLAPLFLERLRDRDDGVRAEAVSAFAQLAKAKRALEAASSALPLATKDRALSVRLAAVRLAASLDDRPALTAFLADPDVSVTLAAASAQKLDPSAATPIVERGLRSPEWPTRVATLNHLVALLGPAAAQQRARAAALDPELSVRLAAARVLGQSGAKPEALSLLLSVASPPDQVPMTSHTIEAAVDLIHLGDPRGEYTLSRALTFGPPDLRLAAASAHLLARKLTPSLLAALADPSGPVRLTAASALAALAKEK